MEQLGKPSQIFRYKQGKSLVSGEINRKSKLTSFLFINYHIISFIVFKNSPSNTWRRNPCCNAYLFAGYAVIQADLPFQPIPYPLSAPSDPAQFQF